MTSILWGRPARLSAAAAFFASLAFSHASAQGLDLDVPYVPTPPSVVEKMLDLAQVKEGDNVIDLGSGDGRIAIAAAKRGARAYGVDLNPQRIAEAEANAKEAGVEVTFKEQNLFDTNISGADVITMYLLPSVNRDLRQRILDLKPGTRIVSHAFDMGEWEPDERASVDGRTVYHWVVPAKFYGRWNVEHNGETVNLSLNQNFQKLKGSAEVGGTRMDATGEIKGEVVRITFGEGESRREFVGRINGSSFEPVEAENAKGTWKATRA
ncbi:methyltransferase [Agaricicola taiwanensis]|uniref:Methyltransferase n=1 Tax=Agaricicola taiwanensis TaxID=591372 RepID=A0A8J2VIT5_9RHOB|nr:methyltransferase domain-containing protein [Agaricicola taiwanensis]GGE32119.1 methyltransferase [Agaricicola taiwanensis]